MECVMHKSELENPNRQQRRITVNSCNDILERSTKDVIETVLEYGRIGSLKRPSKEDFDRMSKILDRAVEDEILNFWISEMDHILMHELNLLEEGWLDNHKDWMALLREYAGKSIPATKPELEPEVVTTGEFNYNSEVPLENKDKREVVHMG